MVEEDPTRFSGLSLTLQHRDLVGRLDAIVAGITVLATAGDYALVRLDLYTGRQHQIRVHLAHHDTPIVGDKLYGPDEMLLSRGADNELTEEDLVLLELPRHALHAYQDRVTHCFTGEEITFTAPFPADLCEFWREQGGEVPPNVLHH